MANISGLRKSISQMNNEDAMQLIIVRRRERGIAKTNRRKGKSKKLAKQTLNPSQLVAAMTGDQRAKLRAELLGE